MQFKRRRNAGDDEERAAIQGLSEEGERLERQRSELEGQVAQLEARVHQLESTLERERAEAAARVTELEQQLAADRRSGQELERAAGPAAAQHQPVERVEPADGETALHVEDNGDGPQADGVEESPEEPSAGRRRRTRFWRRRATPPCAVCQKRPPDLSDAELTESGWAVNRAGSLCPACQQDGWQLPAGSAVPSRPMSDPAG